MQKTRTYRGDIVFSRKIARSPVITTRLKGGINPDVKYMKNHFCVAQTHQNKVHISIWYVWRIAMGNRGRKGRNAGWLAIIGLFHILKVSFLPLLIAFIWVKNVRVCENTAFFYLCRRGGVYWRSVCHKKLSIFISVS